MCITMGMRLSVGVVILRILYCSLGRYERHTSIRPAAVVGGACGALVPIGQCWCDRLVSMPRRVSCTSELSHDNML